MMRINTKVLVACLILILILVGNAEGAKFSIDDSVKTTANLYVRDIPAGNAIRDGKPEPVNTIGTVTDGPKIALYNGVSYTWWKIRYDDEVEGWSAENWLVKAARPKPKFEIGDTIKTTDCLNVRIKPGVDYDEVDYPENKKCEELGTKGEILDFSPRPRVVGGFNWWKIKYEDGVEGWSAENWLEKITPTPTITPSPTLTPSPTPTLTPSPTPTITPSPTPTLTPSPTPTLTPSPTPTITPSPTPTLAPSPTPTLTPPPALTVTPAPTPKPTPTLTPIFNIGDKVKVHGTENLMVRTGPGTSSEYHLVEKEAEGKTGVVIHGPESGDNYIWWVIEYKDGNTGWSAQKYLEKYDYKSFSMPKFLTLPFTDKDIKIQQGYFYNFKHEKSGYNHKGIDYINGTIDRSNTWKSFDVVAAADGYAIQSEDGSYGKFVYIWHDNKDADGNNLFTLYAHLKEVAEGIPTKSYDTRDKWKEDHSDWKYVKRGEFIGKAGDTGSKGLIHLHFEVQRGGYKQNKTDPYDVYREFNPKDNSYTECGQNSLWTQTTCPSSIPSNQHKNIPEIQKVVEKGENVINNVIFEVQKIIQDIINNIRNLFKL